jgi:hypothetical protein
VREAGNYSNISNSGVDNFSARGQMMNRGRGAVSMPDSSSTQNQFVLPEDAVRSGEIAMVVDNLESAKKAVTEIAAKDSGMIFSSFISYASDNLKNGSIVVQVPVSNFDAVFGDLKKIGNKIVQESTQQIPTRINYPVPMNAEIQSPATQNATEENSPSVDNSASNATPEIAIYPGIVRPQSNQDKGYVRVVFVDYGANRNAGSMMREDRFSVGSGSITSQDPRSNLLVIFGIKLIFLIAILGLLIVIFKNLFHKVRGLKKEKKTVHIVRQMPKTRARVVRVQKKK